ncbi:hypothetical protein [Clostridium butyricum]|uniref:hypothetical protein n=1 Tax=Clostridium butyricum TaxID=1492 RepID=UPI0009037008|nr:hypothetical protein [Clostridium butyricum]APF24261.1 hypothetical protein NPD4_2759 [Clostridium butyricum]
MENNIVNTATVVSSICAILGVPSAIISVIMFFKNRNIKNDIEAYHQTLLAKDDLSILSSQRSSIKKSAELFNKLTCKENDSKNNTKVEINYYKDIKIDVENILYNIPDEYKSIVVGLREIKKALLYCIRENITLDKVSNDLGYNYDYVETRFEKIISEITKTTRDITLSI